MNEQQGIMLSRGLTWLIGISLPVLMGMGITLGGLLQGLRTDVAVLKRDMAEAISVAYKNEDELDRHKEADKGELLLEMIDNLEKQIDAITK